jgi:hypothetical protein
LDEGVDVDVVSLGWKGAHLEKLWFTVFCT